jgi:hypothetical protein
VQRTPQPPKQKVTRLGVGSGDSQVNKYIYIYIYNIMFRAILAQATARERPTPEHPTGSRGVSDVPGAIDLGRNFSTR